MADWLWFRLRGLFKLLARVTYNCDVVSGTGICLSADDCIIFYTTVPLSAVSQQMTASSCTTPQLSALSQQTTESSSITNALSAVSLQPTASSSTTHPLRAVSQQTTVSTSMTPPLSAVSLQTSASSSTTPPLFQKITASCSLYDNSTERCLSADDCVIIYDPSTECCLLSRRLRHPLRPIHSAVSASLQKTMPSSQTAPPRDVSSSPKYYLSVQWRGCIG